MDRRDLDNARIIAVQQLDTIAGRNASPEVFMQRANAVVFLYLVDTLRWFFEEFLTQYRMRGR